MHKEFRHFIGSFQVRSHLYFAFERRQPRNVLQCEGKFIRPAFKHFGMVGAKAEFINHAPLKIFHDRFVQVLIDKPLFQNIAYFTERALVVAVELLVNEHVADMIIHKFSAFFIRSAAGKPQFLPFIIIERRKKEKRFVYVRRFALPQIGKFAASCCKIVYFLI